MPSSCSASVGAQVIHRGLLLQLPFSSQPLSCLMTSLQEMQMRAKHRAACQLPPAVPYGGGRTQPPAHTRGSQLGLLKNPPNLRMDLSLFCALCEQAELGNEPGQRFLSFQRFVPLACAGCVLSVPSWGRFPGCLTEFGFPHPILSRRA